MSEWFRLYRTEGEWQGEGRSERERDKESMLKLDSSHD